MCGVGEEHAEKIGALELVELRERRIEAGRESTRAQRRRVEDGDVRGG
jgi:hypothetical protein